MALILKYQNMKKFIFTVILAIMPLSIYAQKADKIFKEALIHLSNENYTKAIPLLEKCLQKEYYLDGDIFAYLYDAYNGIGKVETAQDFIRSGLEVFPNNRYIVLAMLDIFVASSDYNNALILIDKAIQIEPKNVSLFYLKGCIYLELAEIDRGIELLKYCSVLDPKYTSGDIQIGNYYYDQILQKQEVLGGLDENNMSLWGSDVRNSCLFFEKAFNNETQVDIKLSIAQHLCDLCPAMVCLGEDDYEEKLRFYENYLKSGGL